MVQFLRYLGLKEKTRTWPKDSTDKKRISSVYSVYDKTDLFDAIGWLNSVDIHDPDIDWSKHIISNSDDMDWLYQLI